MNINVSYCAKVKTIEFQWEPESQACEVWPAESHIRPLQIACLCEALRVASVCEGCLLN